MVLDLIDRQLDTPDVVSERLENELVLVDAVFFLRQRRDTLSGICVTVGPSETERTSEPSEVLTTFSYRNGYVFGLRAHSTQFMRASASLKRRREVMNFVTTSMASLPIAVR